MKVEWYNTNDKLPEDRHYVLIAHPEFKTPIKAKFINNGFWQFDFMIESIEHKPCFVSVMVWQFPKGLLWTDLPDMPEKLP